MLVTLTYRLDAELAGAVTTYPVSAELRRAWRSAEQLMAKREASRPDRTAKQGDGRWLPTASLTTALRAALADVAVVTPPRDDDEHGSWLVTRTAVDPWLLRTTVAAWQRAAVGTDTGLAAAVERTLPRTVDVGELLAGMAQPDKRPPGWVWEAARWEAMRRLSREPLDLGYRTVVLRLDSDGQLLSWDDPTARTVRGRTDAAMHRVLGRVITMPGERYPLLRLDAGITRVATFQGGAEHAWVDLDRPGAALLYTPLWRRPWDGRTARRYPTGLAATVESTGATALPELPDDPAAAPLGPVRLQHSGAARHPLGTGTGQAFLDVLQRAADSALDSGRRLDLKPSGLPIGPRRRTGPPSVRALTAASEAYGTRLHVHVLTADGEARERMRRLLSEQLLGDPAILAADDAQPADAGPVTVTFHPPVAGLTGGVPLDLPSLPPPALGERAAALVQTSTALRTTADDPKPPARRILAAQGIVTQFLDQASAPRGTGADHAAIAAWRDLLRAAGLLDDRIAERVAVPPGPALLVGVYLRRVQQQGLGAVVTALLVPDAADPDRSWTALGYRPVRGWLSYPDALTDHHAGELVPAGHRGSQQQAHASVRSYVDSALDQLLREHPAHRDVAFLEAERPRQLWSGLQNSHLGAGPLPGGPAYRDRLAVVRLNRSDEVPQPVCEVTATGARRQPTKLFASTAAATWLLASKSPALLGAMSSTRHGNHATRFHVQDGTAARGRLEDNWHALTATEISVIRAAGWDASELALLTARLCDQAASWDGRTGLPAPLHMAKQQFDGHPGSPPASDRA